MRNIIISLIALALVACATSREPDITTRLNGLEVNGWRSDDGASIHLQVIGPERSTDQELIGTLKMVAANLCGRVYSMSEPETFFRGGVDRDRPFVSDPSDINRQRPPHADLDLPAERWVEADVTCERAGD